MSERASDKIPALKYGYKIYPEDLAMMVGLPYISTVYYIDPANGSASNPGTRSNNALVGVQAAHDATTNNQHDVVVYLAGSSGISEDDITWSNSYTHFIGNASPTYNSRARISASSVTTDLLTVSGSGNIFRNLRFGAFEDLNVLATVTGDRNFFGGVSFQGGGHATAADDANMRSLVLSGAEENTFAGCWIGLATIPRANVASAELEFASSSAHNEFIGCKFLKAADGVGNLFIKGTGTGGILRENEFNNCRFWSFWTNDADKITAAVDISAQTQTGHLLFSGPDTLLVGADDWEGTASGRLWFGQYGETTAKFGIAANQTV